MIQSSPFPTWLAVCLASAVLWGISCDQRQPAIDAGHAPSAGEVPQVTAPVESPASEPEGEEDANDSSDQPKTEKGSPLLGQQAPGFELELLGGGTAKLADHRNRDIVLIDFWATWCGPCVRELPMLVEIAAEYRDKGVVFYAVNEGEEPETIRTFLDDKKYDIAVPLDTEGAVADSYAVRGIPTLFVIDKKGIVAGVHEGYDPQIQEKLRQELDALREGKDLAKPSGESP